MRLKAANRAALYLIVYTEFEQLTLHHRARYNMAKGMTQRLERRRTVEMMGPVFGLSSAVSL